MVLTRAQAKREAKSSPEAASLNSSEKHLRKKAVQPLGEKTSSNIVLPGLMGQTSTKLNPADEAKAFPSSHPISFSVPPSPIGQPDQNMDIAVQSVVAPHSLPIGEKLLPKPSERPLVPSERLPDGPEPVQIDVEYLPREELQSVDNPAEAIHACHAGLQAADWVETVKGLNMLRQLVVHHQDVLEPHLEKLLSEVLKAIRSLRSSVCKTAIMAVADLYISYGDKLLPATDTGGLAKPMTSLLAQTLLKASSNDKKFVIEEAQKTLLTMADTLTPAQFCGLIQPYADAHKNPKVRGKAGVTMAASVARMQAPDMLDFGMDRVLQLAGKLITDNTPEARDSAKRIVSLVSLVFADPAVQETLNIQVPDPPAPADGEEPPPRQSEWEYFCRQNLNTSAAIAVLKVVD